MCAFQKKYPVPASVWQTRLQALVTVVALTALSAVHPELARADTPVQPGLRVERLDAVPSIIEGYTRLTFHATPVTLQGAFMSDITGKNAWALTIGKKTKKLPYIAGQFHALPDELAVAIVIDTSADFAEILEDIQKRVTRFIESLPKKRTQVSIISFDNEVRGSKRVMSVNRALAAVARLYGNTDPGDKLLLEAVKRAHRAVSRAKPLVESNRVRKLIIVISDGRDASYPNPANYRRIAKKAARAHIPIHTIGFAPDGNRLPLRGLGELSKRSVGTFRFAYTKSGFERHFKQLGAEVNDRYTVTFFVPEKEVKNKKVGLLASTRDMASIEQVRLAKLACGEKSCAKGKYCVNDSCVTRNLDGGRGVLGWILLIGGIVVGGLLGLVLLGFIMGRIAQRRQQAPMPEVMAGAGAQEPGGSMQFGAQQSGHMAAMGLPGQMPGQIPGQQSGQAPGQSQHHRIQPSGGPVHTGQQRVLPTGNHPPVAQRPSSMNQQGPRPSLLVIEGPLQGQRIPLFNGFTIGKAHGCHLHLVGDNYASGHHARVIVDTRGTCTLTDLGSTNGTFINGVRMTGQRQLQHGMLVGIGATKARFLSQ